MRFFAVVVALVFTVAAFAAGVYLAQTEPRVPRIADLGATNLEWKLRGGEEAAYVLSHHDETEHGASGAPAIDMDVLLNGGGAERFLPAKPPTQRAATMSIARGDDGTLHFLIERDREPGAQFPPPGYANRGTVDEKGHVTSSYLPRDVQNLVHLYVGLPRQAVRVGDTWPVDVFLTSVPGSGGRPKFERRADARLVALEQQGASRIAVIDTVAVERYADDAQDGGNVKMAMVQRSRFDVDKGILLDVSGNATATTRMTGSGFEGASIASTYHLTLAAQAAPGK